RFRPWSAEPFATVELSNEQVRLRRGTAHLGSALLFIHGVVAVALLGAITHQALAAWAPARGRPDSFFGRFRAVPCASYANAIVILYAVSTLLGGTVYLNFRVDIRPDLERVGHWQAL